MGDRGSGNVTRATAPVFTDARGTLTLVACEQIPFTPRRTYVLHRLPIGALRGGHANRTQRRLLVGLSGCATVTIDDPRGGEDSIALGGGDTLLIEPGVWHEIEIHDDEVAILVFADGAYDPGDYVTDRSAASTASQTDFA